MKVKSITITAGGHGYKTPPAVTITGDGAGATAVCTLSAGKVSHINVVEEGAGYTVPPEVTVADGPDGHGTGATATAIIV